MEVAALADVECAAQNQRYHLIVSTVEEESGLMPRVVADGNVDGVILAGGHSAEMIDRIQAVIPTVVVNDRISGVGASCIAAADLGIPVPDGLSIVGIGDDSACEHVRPNLTSIRAPLEEMGAAAVGALINRLAHPDAACMSQFFDVKLVARKSCAPLPSPAASQTGND